MNFCCSGHSFQVVCGAEAWGVISVTPRSPVDSFTFCCLPIATSRCSPSTGSASSSPIAVSPVPSSATLVASYATSSPALRHPTTSISYSSAISTSKWSHVSSTSSSAASRLRFLLRPCFLGLHPSLCAQPKFSWSHRFGPGTTTWSMMGPLAHLPALKRPFRMLSVCFGCMLVVSSRVDVCGAALAFLPCCSWVSIDVIRPPAFACSPLSSLELSPPWGFSLPLCNSTLHRCRSWSLYASLYSLVRCRRSSFTSSKMFLLVPFMFLTWKKSSASTASLLFLFFCLLWKICGWCLIPFLFCFGSFPHSLTLCFQLWQALHLIGNLSYSTNTLCGGEIPSSLSNLMQLPILCLLSSWCKT